MYKLVTKSARTEIVINKSRFIGTSFSLFSEDEAKEKIAAIKKEFSDATHNTYAYVFDSLGNALKFSDDGEPQGTAGMPILAVIKNKNLAYTGVVVTRYFGGIKLGAGGLVRAYTECAAKTLDLSVVSEMREAVTFKVTVDYSLSDKLNAYAVKLIQKSAEYSDKVSLVFIEKEDLYTKIKEEITDLTNGKAVITEIERGFYAF